jgi:ABC-type transporter Mla subunit MlaD
MSEDVFRIVVAAGVTLAGIAFIVQTLLLFGMYRAAKTVNEKISSLSDRAEPVLDNARKMLEENRPKLTQITDQTLEVVASAKSQAQRLDTLLTDTSDRARAQMERIDFLLEDTVGRVQETTAALQSTILRPVREVHGLVSGVRAALTALARGSRPSVDHVTQDEEMFI